MDQLPKIYGGLKYVQLLAFTILLIRLYSCRLAGIYPYFTIYVWVTVVRLAALAAAPYGTNLYGWIYVTSEPVTWLACGVAILEVYSLVLKNHPGIATLGRKALVASMGASVLLAFCTLLLDFQDTAVKYPILENLLLLSRLVMVCLLIFVALITCCLLWFPIRLNKNTVVHCGVFAAYFMLKAGSFISVRAFPGKLPHINAAVQGLTALCCGAWMFWLQPAGEKLPVTLGHSWDRTQERRLMEQLDSINRTLAGSAKN